MNDRKLTKTVIVRRLHPRDHAEIRDHFLRLDKAARTARFCGAISDGGVAAYARGIFRHHSIICGAFVDGHLRGVAELRSTLPIWCSTAEAAFSVEPDWQDNGIGDLLVERTIAAAQNRLVKSVWLMCQKSNIRMCHLAEKHDARLAFDHDMVDAIIFPHWPTPVSLAAEVCGRLIQRLLWCWASCGRYVCPTPSRSSG